MKQSSPITSSQPRLGVCSVRPVQPALPGPGRTWGLTSSASESSPAAQGGADGAAERGEALVAPYRAGSHRDGGLGVGLPQRLLRLALADQRRLQLGLQLLALIARLLVVGALSLQLRVELGDVAVDCGPEVRVSQQRSPMVPTP